jgi:predicted transcriptional regulator
MIKLMILCVASLLFAPEINNLCVEDSCDYIEINDFGETGEDRKQIVFWEWRK